MNIVSNAPSPEAHVGLHIFVNRRRFGPEQGVEHRMTGAQIAALVQVPADLAVVRRENPPHSGGIPINETVEVHNGDHFLVTRRHVEGG
jgi:hypothetical protein